MSNWKRQIRGIPQTFRTRDDESGDKYISGYFVVFGSNYEIWDGATESVDPHAFDEALDADIRCLIDHDTRLVLGRTKSGTLTLKVDQKGLYGEVKINQADQDAMNLYERVKRGDVDQCSFGFDIVSERYEETEAGIHWTIEKVILYEVSVCTFPAYEETEVSARKKDYGSIKKREMDAWKKKTLGKLKGDK